MRKKVFAIGTVLIWLIASFIPSNAQEQKQETLKIDTALVSVPVIVSDRQGRYISGLKASDFTLYEDRIKQPIDFFADTEEPINVALLLDTSKSTTMVLDDIKKAAKDFVKQLRPQDRAMIVSFDFNETALCELTSDRKTLEKAIGKARIGDVMGTKLRDAVFDVMREEFRTVKGRKAIVLLTDGKDHGSEVSERKLLDAATEADTLIYSVFYQSLPPNFAGRDRGGWGGRGGRRGGIFIPRFPVPPQRRGRIEARNAEAIEFLQELSSVSAGRYFDSEVAKLKETFGQIVEELRHQYRLGFYPGDHAPGSIHSLKVEVARPDVVVRSRRSYRVAGKSQSE
ncbi:MAG: VWA domain-containing protein [Acidobacteria bacterium]|nr:VWA domain-containing protein [Acidobacteriota bacterium]